MTVYGARERGAARFDAEPRTYDAVLIVSYGGPEGPEDVLPFLENATRGRGVPRERLLEVAEHYLHFDGVSPLNAQNRALARALERDLAGAGLPLPVYLGNRNWHPFLADTLRSMHQAGVGRAIVFVTSAFSCYSGCRQYREHLIAAREQVGRDAPELDRVRVFFNHPGFIEANAENLRTALARLPAGERAAAPVLFTAHSIPVAMARQSAYEAQLREASRLTALAAGVGRWELVYQSRSGPPRTPWLGPDVIERLDQLAGDGVRSIVLLPIGFLSDHMEVRYDLDVEARAQADALGVRLLRAATVGTAPAFVAMIRELIVERMTSSPVRRALGSLGPSHDVCPIDCCTEN